MKKGIFLILLCFFSFLTSCKDIQTSTNNINKDKLDYTLQFVSLNLGDGGAYYNTKNHFVKFESPDNLEEYTDIIDSLLGDDYYNNLLQISANANRALIGKYDQGHVRVQDIIYDINSKNTIVSFDYPNSNGDYNSYSSSLDYCITKYDNVLYFNDINNNSKKKLIINIEDINYNNIIFSPQGNKIAFTKGKEKNEICIYNLESDKIEQIIQTEDGFITLSQWSYTDKIIYNINTYCKTLKISDKSVDVIGEFMFYPLLSQDGLFVAFARPTYELVESYCSEEDIKKYEEEQTYGIFIKSLIDGTITKISLNTADNQLPIIWFKTP